MSNGNFFAELKRRNVSIDFLRSAPVRFVIVYVGLGDKEEALRWLEQSYQDRAGSDIGWIRVDSLVDPLRDEALAEKIVPAREFKGTTASR
jgi:hypothetical protein